MLEKNIVDELFSKSLGELERERLWKSAQNILSHRPVDGCSTGLALGYVQSGKTTQMIALTAAAHDAGYRIVVALLGSTNLLLDQKSAKKYISKNSKSIFKEKIVLHLLNIIQIKLFLINKNLSSYF